MLGPKIKLVSPTQSQGQNHGCNIKKIRDTCQSDNSKIAYLILIFFGKMVVIGMSKNSLGFGKFPLQKFAYLGI